MTDALRLDTITKTFLGVTALSRVSFSVRPGEVHALVGGNGAGKSTLMAVAAGVLAPDSGVVEIGGRRLSRVSPAVAQELGLAVVYQHATTLDDLTVRENLLLSLPEDRRPARAQATSWVQGHLDAAGAAVRAADRAERLAPAQRQLVEIARALALESRVLVLDEPTESLTAAESELLFQQIARLRAAGAGVVYISHRFPEVQRVADRISVLRDGQLRGTFAVSDVTENDVLELIVGREVERIFPPKSAIRRVADPPLVVERLSGSRFAEVDLVVGAGEIVGLAGVEGNGQRDFIRAIAGLTSSSGTVRLRGNQIDKLTPRTTAEAGLVHLPADRHEDGLFLPMSVRENTTVLVLDQISDYGLINRREERERALAAVERLAVRTPSVETPVASLSGGNQQKVLFARSMEAEPSVLLADEPTRGVDVGARAEIYRLLRDFTERGNSVVALSSDAVELAGLCDRVLVFSRGQVVNELTGDDLTERSITGAAIGATTTRAAPAGAASDRRRRLPRLADSDYSPSAVLGVLLVLLTAAATARNPLFLSERNLSGLLMLASILALVACGQLTTMLTGSIDLSVGPLVGISIVLMSFFAVDGKGTSGLLLGVLVCLAAGLLVGLINGLLVRFVQLPAVIATLVMYIVLEGSALLLRPNPSGYIDGSTTTLLQTKLGAVPVAAVAMLVAGLAAERVLRRSRSGIALRAVGSDEVRARRLGTPVNRTVIAAHVICSLLTALAGVLLCSLVGVGQAGVGSQYTLTSISAVVLGGASIFGGRGSYVGALAGTLLIQTVISATTFLNLEQAWQEWLPGLLILLGAAIFSGVRRRALGRASGPSPQSGSTR